MSFYCFLPRCLRSAYSMNKSMYSHLEHRVLNHQIISYQTIKDDNRIIIKDSAWLENKYDGYVVGIWRERVHFNLADQFV